jgi:hypothetical protein
MLQPSMKNNMTTSIPFNNISSTFYKLQKYDERMRNPNRKE